MSDPNFRKDWHRRGPTSAGDSQDRFSGDERPDEIPSNDALGHEPDVGRADEERSRRIFGGESQTGGGAPAGEGGGAGNDGNRQDVPALRGGGQVAPAREHSPAMFSPASAYGEPLVDEGRIDLRKYFWILFRHRWLIAGSAAVFLIIGLFSTLLTTPIYRASTTIQIDRQIAKVVEFDAAQGADSSSDWEFYQTQYELLRSRSLAERIAADFSLQDDQTFMTADAPSPSTRLRLMLFGARSENDTRDVKARQADAAGRILGGLSVEPVRNSSIVRLSYDNPNPQVAQKIVNAVADGYIALNLERRYEASAYAREFLEERLEQLKIKLAESEKELVAYAEAEKLVSAGAEQTLAMTNLAAANDELAKVTNERLRKEQIWRQIDGSEGIALPQIMQSEAIATMRAKQVELSSEYEDKLSRYKPAFPEMRQIKAQIDELGRQVATEVALIKQSTKAEYEASLGEEQSLAALVETLKTEVTDFRNRNIQYNILQREVDTNRSLYDGLLQRYKEIGVAGGVGINNISVVDSARVPGSPYTPRLSRNLAISLMLGLMFGGAAAFAREHFDDTFKSPEDVEENLGLPLLGIIPLVRKKDNLIELTDEPHSAMAEAYRSLRTALQFSTVDGVPKSMLVTCSRAGEGKSTTAVTLAKNFSQLGMRVLLVDADLRKPTLHKYFEIDPSVGLTNFLTGTDIPPGALQNTSLPGLTLMASGPLPPNPAELLASPKMLSLLTIAGQEYDLLIIDGPPVAGLADAPLLASMIVGTLMVIDAKKTRKGAVKAALKRLYFARAHVVGAVINKLDHASASYGYGYEYGYGDNAYYGQEPKEKIGYWDRLTHRKQSSG